MTDSKFGDWANMQVSRITSQSSFNRKYFALIIMAYKTLRNKNILTLVPLLTQPTDQPHVVATYSFVAAPE